MQASQHLRFQRAIMTHLAKILKLEGFTTTSLFAGVSKGTLPNYFQHVYSEYSKK